jgi:uncharacterized low-complexity protein
VDATIGLFASCFQLTHKRTTIMAQSKKPLIVALSAAFLASSVVPMATAEVNPFSAQSLNGGYDLANYDKHKEGKCGEGKCGEKTAEGKCGEKDAEGKCGEKDAEGACGEKDAEGSCGGAKAAEKDGEGKCGGA